MRKINKMINNDKNKEEVVLSLPFNSDLDLDNDDSDNDDLYLEDNPNNREPWHNSLRLYAVYHNTVPL